MRTSNLFDSSLFDSIRSKADSRRFVPQPSHSAEFSPRHERIVTETHVRSDRATMQQSVPSTSGRQNSTTPAMYPNNHPSPPRPTVAGYLDRITIAGLHNYLYATDFYEKVVWILTFLVAIVGTMFYLVPTIQQYLEYTIVLDIQHRVEPGLELPPVWVCTPGLNHTYFNEYYDSVRSQLLVDTRMRLILERYSKAWRRILGPLRSEYEYTDPKTGIRYTHHSIWNSERGVWEWQPGGALDSLSIRARVFTTFSDVVEGSYKEVAVPQILSFLLLSIEAMGTNWTGYKAFYEQGMFQCESIVKNCTLNGIPFGCCRADPIGRVRATEKCFKIDLPKVSAALDLHPKQTSKFELSLETIIDSADLNIFGTGDATTGGISFGNRMTSLFEYGELLGSGSTTTITVRGIKKIEQTNCTSNKFRPDPRLHVYSHPIIRDYFEEMSDPTEYSVGACEFGKLLEELYIKCGCVLYYDTMRPQNDSVICRPQHINACILGAFQNTGSPEVAPSTNSSTKSSSTTSAVDGVKQDLLRRVKDAAAKECLPLCESWTYDFFSTSMASDGEASNITRYFRSKAVIIFDPEYRVETEVYKMNYHELIASLGDGFGLILGISAITLIQFPIWTVAAVLLKRKLNRIAPLQVRQGRPSTNPHVQITAV